MSLKYYFEDFCFDTKNELLSKNGALITVAEKNLQILHFLLKNKDKYVKENEIIEAVWKDKNVEEFELIQHISILNQTLGQTANGELVIDNSSKKGYRFKAKVTEKITEDSAISNINEGYKFGEFSLDKQRRMLYQKNQPITPPSKVFETLLYLIENSGRLITKDELMEKVWQDRYVEENNLTQKIFILRRMLGDEKKDHQYIVTVPGEGYIFVAPVTKIEPPTVSPSIVSDNHTEKKKSDNTLAVLPFKFLPENAFAEKENLLVIGLTDAITLQLSRYQELVVRPTSSVLRYAKLESDSQNICRDLQVSYLVEGIILQFDRKMKISVRLFESATGGIIWGEDFFGENEDILSLQNKIASQISKALGKKLALNSPIQENPLPQNFEAFQEYVKGKFHWNKRTIDGLKQGILQAQKTLDIEPTFAMAYVGMADCYNLLAGQHAYLRPNEAFPKAKAASLRALEISGENLAEAYTSLAFSTYYYDRNRQEAEKYFQKATDLKPNYPTVYHWWGEALASENRFDEAIDYLKKAQELDPLSPAITTDLAQVFLLAERLDECHYLLDQILEIHPNFINALYFYALAYERTSDFEKAIGLLEKAVELAPNEPTLLAELACANAYYGNREKSRQILEELKQMGENRYISGVLMATIYSALDELDEVYHWLEIAVEDRDVWLVWISLFPKLNELFNSPKFAPLANKIR